MAQATSPSPVGLPAAGPAANEQRHQYVAMAIMVALLLVAPYVLYPIFVMKVLCFALFASAFNLLIGYVGLLSFGHAAFFGTGGYMAGHALKVWGSRPSWRWYSAALWRQHWASSSACSPSAARASTSR
jgi:branched-chain amino acid transport system permease protein